MVSLKNDNLPHPKQVLPILNYDVLLSIVPFLSLAALSSFMKTCRVLHRGSIPSLLKRGHSGSYFHLSSYYQCILGDFPHRLKYIQDLDVSFLTGSSPTEDIVKVLQYAPNIVSFRCALWNGKMLNHMRILHAIPFQRGLQCLDLTASSTDLVLLFQKLRSPLKSVTLQVSEYLYVDDSGSPPGQQAAVNIMSLLKKFSRTLEYLSVDGGTLVAFPQWSDVIYPHVRTVKTRACVISARSAQLCFPNLHSFEEGFDQNFWDDDDDDTVPSPHACWSALNSFTGFTTTLSRFHLRPHVNQVLIRKHDIIMQSDILLAFLRATIVDDLALEVDFGGIADSVGMQDLEYLLSQISETGTTIMSFSIKFRLFYIGSEVKYLGCLCEEFLVSPG